jgi:hypothetical protein
VDIGMNRTGTSRRDWNARTRTRARRGCLGVGQGMPGAGQGDQGPGLVVCRVWSIDCGVLVTDKSRDGNGSRIVDN